MSDPNNTFGSIKQIKIVSWFLNQLESKSPPKIATQFKTVDCFTYLGIQIAPQLEYIVASNYEPLLQEISKLLEIWTPILMSLSNLFTQS